MLKYLFAVVLAFCAVRAAPALSATCSQSFIFATGQVLTATNLNSNPANEIACINNIDNQNIGPAGIYASQILPTTPSQATFGGAQTYTIGSLTVTGTFTLPGTFSPGSISTTGNIQAGSLRTTSAQACGFPSGYHVECGFQNYSGAVGAGLTYPLATVTFNVAYSNPPLCYVTVSNASTAQNTSPYSTTTATASQFTPAFYAINQVLNPAFVFDWLCIGV